MYHVVNVVVYVVLFTKLACEGKAGEMLQPVEVNGVNIKPNHEGGEEPDVGDQRHGDEDPLAVFVEGSEGDVGQEGEGEQQAAQEAEDVGDVVDPRQKAAQEEEEHDAQEFEEGLPRLFQHLPTLEKLDEEASKEPKLGPSRTHLDGGKNKEKLFVSREMSRRSLDCSQQQQPSCC